jgi:hypothetical protein
VRPVLPWAVPHHPRRQRASGDRERDRGSACGRSESEQAGCANHATLGPHVCLCPGTNRLATVVTSHFHSLHPVPAFGSADRYRCGASRLNLSDVGLLLIDPPGTSCTARTQTRHRHSRERRRGGGNPGVPRFPPPHPQPSAGQSGELPCRKGCGSRRGPGSAALSKGHRPGTACHARLLARVPAPGAATWHALRPLRSAFPPPARCCFMSLTSRPAFSRRPGGQRIAWALGPSPSQQAIGQPNVFGVRSAFATQKEASHGQQLQPGDPHGTPDP